MENSSDRLRKWALEVGFDRAGIATLEPSAYAQAIRRWLARGDHATMAYMARRTESRLDPRSVFSGARSVICVALQYSPLEGREEPDGDLWPRVARYARGLDYHDLMKQRLEKLAVRIRDEFPGCATRPYVDTGPILERELAARAGLGAFGKNTMLLSELSGSWFLLGELFLSLNLDPDRPVTDLCGTCSRCLESCPTGALAQPYRLDANRCISYWTIEHRGSIPLEIRHQMAGWVFGCDLCQEACPWNEDAIAVDQPELQLSPHRAKLDLAALLRIDRDTYVERFRKSPMKRAKQEGLQRNAALAIGNSGDSRFVPSLLEALRDESALVRAHVAWALGEIGGQEAMAALKSQKSIEPDSEVAQEIDWALARLERPDA